MIKLDIEAVSFVGKVREHNEDMILVSNKLCRDDSLNTKVMLDTQETYLVAVSDGLGGHNAGDVASNDVALSIRDFVQFLPDQLTIAELKDAFNDWLDETHFHLLQKGKMNPEMLGMGATLVGFLIYENRFFWMNCGDSRLYRYRNNVLTQISVDHSLFNITCNPKDFGVLTNCIGGGGDEVYLDFEEFTDEVLDNDIYILCSDGFSDMLKDAGLESLLAAGATIQQMIDEACERGGLDNISALKITLNK